MIDLSEKTAVITGAAQGIGLAITEKLAMNNAAVIIVDINKKLIDQRVEMLTSRGLNAAGYQADVTKSDQIEDIFKEISSTRGNIDILINNAGITRDGLLMKMKEEDWDLVLAINLKGTFICTQKVSRYMLKQRSGVIINIASVVGIMGNAGQANYAASKGGIIALTKSTAREFASRNIRVNAVAPGFIETEMTSILSEEVIKKYAEAIPLKRMGKPEDVADLCLFLASDLAKYITGQTIQVDGGLIM
ncbi:MAG: 3-oxoacyl-[acyl-carrier-protein] reductase [Candidatus Cloacimonetes bacterium]|nr:3-oxoacyl-[acyl-carrier-protein] reductase [Candidatus Cloacimonadota bacterium]